MGAHLQPTRRTSRGALSVLALLSAVLAGCGIAEDGAIELPGLTPSNVTSSIEITPQQICDAVDLDTVGGLTGVAWASKEVGPAQLGDLQCKLLAAAGGVENIIVMLDNTVDGPVGGTSDETLDRDGPGDPLQDLVDYYTAELWETSGPPVILPVDAGERAVAFPTGDYVEGLVLYRGRVVSVGVHTTLAGNIAALLQSVVDGLDRVLG